MEKEQQEKERLERERRERLQREREHQLLRDRQLLQQQQQKQISTNEAVDHHFQMSMELAKKVGSDSLTR